MKSVAIIGKWFPIGTNSGSEYSTVYGPSGVCIFGGGMRLDYRTRSFDMGEHEALGVAYDCLRDEEFIINTVNIPEE
jgi:hypothetical protein